MLRLTSPTLVDGQPVPARHRGPGHGGNRSPELSWTGAPDGTTAYALRMVDPAAPGFRHWLALLPADTTRLAEGSDASYVGPCPPSGEHHYELRLYALDVEPDLAAGFSAADLDEATAGHVLASATMAVTYRPGMVVLLRHRLGALRSRVAGRGTDA